jgi:hypothetical protein
VGEAAIGRGKFVAVLDLLLPAHTRLRSCILQVPERPSKATKGSQRHTYLTDALACLGTSGTDCMGRPSVD